MISVPASIALPLSVTNEEFDPTTVTPGWVGFLVTFLVAAATVLLVLDMNRRIRRSRYREEVRQEIAAEEAAQLSASSDAVGQSRSAESPSNGRERQSP